MHIPDEGALSLEPLDRHAMHIHARPSEHALGETMPFEHSLCEKRQNGMYDGPRTIRQ